jgi:hypothetical protein
MLDKHIRATKKVQATGWISFIGCLGDDDDEMGLGCDAPLPMDVGEAVTEVGDGAGRSVEEVVVVVGVGLFVLPLEIPPPLVMASVQVKSHPANEFASHS